MNTSILYGFLARSSLSVATTELGLPVEAISTGLKTLRESLVASFSMLKIESSTLHLVFGNLQVGCH